MHAVKVAVLIAMLGVLGCRPANFKLSEETGAKPADPVASLKLLSTIMQTRGTAPRVIGYGHPTTWAKMKYLAIDVRYDVKKTDSLVSPYMAQIEWHNEAYTAGAFASRDEAENTPLSKEPYQSPADVPDEELIRDLSATLAFQEGKWVLKDIQVGSPLESFAVRHSWLKIASHPAHDWWYALGGRR